MSVADRSLTLAKSVIPLIGVGVIWIVQAGGQFGLLLIPFLAVLVIGIIQAVRASGLIPGFSRRRKLRGSIEDSALRGRSVADDILNQG